MKNLQISDVTLNVNDLEKMMNFYETVVGLQVLEKNSHTAILGIKESQLPLLKLQLVGTPYAFETGLYHTAFLLPERQELTRTIRRIAKQNYPLDGASDHGYSEALYLHDPEGNGIEIYHDKPYEVWDVRDNGEIIGQTEPIDYTGIMALTDSSSTHFPVGTVIGHVHLAVSDLASETNFFTNNLDFTVTTELGNTAAFYGIDGYHHQFAGNIWQSRQQVPYDVTRPGIAEISLAVSKNYFEAILESDHHTDWLDAKSATELRVKTPSGIPMRLTLAS